MGSVAPSRLKPSSPMALLPSRGLLLVATALLAGGPGRGRAADFTPTVLVTPTIAPTAIVTVTTGPPAVTAAPGSAIFVDPSQAAIDARTVSPLTLALQTANPQLDVSQCTDECNVLHDVTLGWAGECAGLVRRIDILNAESCRLACCGDLSCEVWQFGSDGCKTGVGSQCRSHGTSESIVAGQRITHGMIQVLTQALVGIECSGMQERVMYSGTGDEMQQRCRNTCYSSSICTIWQWQSTLTSSHCWLGNSTECDSNTAYAGTYTAGEHVQHLCKRQLTPLANNVGPSPSGSAGMVTLIWFLLAIFALAALMTCIACLLSSRRKSRPMKTRALERDQDEPDWLFQPAPVVPLVLEPAPVMVVEPVVPVLPMYQTLSTVDVHETLMPVSMPSLAPMNGLGPQHSSWNGGNQLMFR